VRSSERMLHRTAINRWLGIKIKGNVEPTMFAELSVSLTGTTQRIHGMV